MKLSLFIAQRYLISRKSHNIINIISGVSVVGVTVGTMALIIVLSVFNGIESLVAGLFNTFDPDLKITFAEGKTFSPDSVHRAELEKIPGLVLYTEVLSENALMKYKGKQHIVHVKGLSEDFQHHSPLDSMMIEGELILKRGERPYAVIGAGVAYYLNASVRDFLNPLALYAPRKNSSMAGLDQAFNSKNIYPSGIFAVQQDFDTRYVLVPLDFAQELFDYKNRITAVELRFESEKEAAKAQKTAKEILGENYLVQNRFEQQNELYRIMKAEKWAIFMILTFILIIATFNVVGSLGMLMIEKKKDASVLSSMGANLKTIRRIFLYEGMLISLSGAVGGLLLGGFLCWLQQSFGFIPMQVSGGSFIVDAYPVEMQLFDFVLVFCTVVLIGYLAALLPIRQINKSYLRQKL